MATETPAGGSQRRHAAPARDGLRAGAQPQDGLVLQLRHLLLDHLDPRRRHDRLLSRPAGWWPEGHRLQLVHRRVLRPARRHGDGRDRVGVPDGRWSLLLVGEAGAQERPDVELVHGLVQHGRPDRDDRVGRLRAGDVHRILHHALPAELRIVGIQRRPQHLHHLLPLPHRPRSVEHVPGRPRGQARRHQRVVARHRRADHLRLPLPRAVAPRELELHVQVEEPHRLVGAVRGCLGVRTGVCCSPSTRSPASTPRRT